ncbi:MAG: hypothetical protein O4861_13415 [Trichodesmium sp. St16_bin4-tuft]|nr:hypothetical protein [Trichodesmium sp. St5_bin8]MDE5077712.1 hypothetical protein [Trichodesmium sp. St2_bin6]MDE5099271.1 hypothetical protein [Trichodesmium sp. St16_bin4-tuft]MDE5103156.1 hypothetical protein [Trichodesmium sp. St19_bin2]
MPKKKKAEIAQIKKRPIKLGVGRKKRLKVSEIGNTLPMNTAARYSHSPTALLPNY